MGKAALIKEKTTKQEVATEKKKKKAKEALRKDQAQIAKRDALKKATQEKEEKEEKKTKRAMAAKAVIDQKMMQNHVRDAKEQGEKKAKAVQEKANKATKLVEVAI